MPTFPIPVFASILLAFAAVQLWLKHRRVSPLVLLLALCAAQSLIIALTQHYEVAGMRLVQPAMAAFIPPAAWFAFRDGLSRSDGMHALGPATVLAALLVAPEFVDVLLPGLFVLYGGAILSQAKQGGDAQPDALLSSGDLPSRIWVVIGAALIGSAFSDLLIIATQISGYPELRPWIISVFSVGNLLLIGALGLSPHLQTTRDDRGTEGPDRRSPDGRVADAHIWDRVQTYMSEHKPYLDPDLTLTRLSRKLGIPAKTLSSTINLTTGGNVSRFINEARIDAAQTAMLNGESVTGAMLSSGFNTKSNFNREFLRVTGKSPTDWLKQAR
mgnify:CR=1 FL=1